MCEEKRSQICLVKEGNEVHSGAMDKLSNENKANFKLFNLCNRFFKGFKIKGETIFSELIKQNNIYLPQLGTKLYW